VEIRFLGHACFELTEGDTQALPPRAEWDDEVDVYGVAWDGRNDAGRVVGAGTYTVYAQARNDLGRIKLERKLDKEEIVGRDGAVLFTAEDRASGAPPRRWSRPG
jgi:hypothetical protein